MLRPIVCSAAIGIAVCAHAAIINVGPGQSIQAAINIASNGDTIVVAPGTYFQAIDFLGKAITVRSSGGADVTTIDASGVATSVVKCINGEGFDTVLDGFTIAGGTGTYVSGKLLGGGMYNLGADTLVRDCIFLQNSADDGAGMMNWLGHPTILGCVFIENAATGIVGLGGGAMFNKLSDATIIDCTFVANDGGVRGGAILNILSDPSIINCEFYQNIAGGGGALHTDGSSTVSLINCTMSDNTAGLGGGILSLGTTLTVFNSILWDNVPEQIYAFSGNASFYSCNVMGGWNGPGSNNMDDEPVFVDPASGDYHLAPNSPCINQGDSSAVPPEIETDLDGLPRFVGAVDLGPYEVQAACPWDLNGDGLVSVLDFLSLLAQWGTAPGGPPDFDGNNSVDVADMLGLLAHWGPCP